MEWPELRLPEDRQVSIPCPPVELAVVRERRVALEVLARLPAGTRFRSEAWLLSLDGAVQARGDLLPPEPGAPLETTRTLRVRPGTYHLLVHSGALEISDCEASYYHLGVVEALSDHQRTPSERSETSDENGNTHQLASALASATATGEWDGNSVWNTRAAWDRSPPPRRPGSSPARPARRPSSRSAARPLPAPGRVSSRGRSVARGSMPFPWNRVRSP